ncbi:MAG: translation initiation factor IF-2, partial [Gammaproteobacteria bacterium]|nr:translation initiation factor IF-2 [Gammaproteobacteria bacterium]
AVATVLIQSGTLKTGDYLLAGKEHGRVRAMFDESGSNIQEATPSTPVVVLGLSGTPNAGDETMVVANEKKAREVAENRGDRHRHVRLASQQAARMEEALSSMGTAKAEVVNVLIKADTQGSSEALRESLNKLSTDEAEVCIVASSIGGITESDVGLAQTSNASIIGFNVRADSGARKAIKDSSSDKEVTLKYYSIIYEVIDDVRQALTGKLAPEIREQINGVAEVREVFRVAKLGQVAGCMVTEGVMKRNQPIRVLRDNVVVFEGELESLKRYKDDAGEVRAGTECGIGVKNYNDVKAGDQIECYERIEVARTLES